MKKILKEPVYQIRCPYCSCHFLFELEDLSDYHRVVKCPHCGENIRIKDSDTGYLKDIVKVSYVQKNDRPMVTVAGWAFLADKYEDVTYWSESNSYNGEDYVDYCFEIAVKDKEPTLISTCDKDEAEDWARRLGIDIVDWRKEVADPITVIARKEVEHQED